MRTDAAKRDLDRLKNANQRRLKHGLYAVLDHPYWGPHNYTEKERVRQETARADRNAWHDIYSECIEKYPVDHDIWDLYYMTL